MNDESSASNSDSSGGGLLGGLGNSLSGLMDNPLMTIGLLGGGAALGGMPGALGGLLISMLMSGKNPFGAAGKGGQQKSPYIVPWADGESPDSGNDNYTPPQIPMSQQQQQQMPNQNYNVPGISDYTQNLTSGMPTTSMSQMPQMSPNMNLQPPLMLTPGAREKRLQMLREQLLRGGQNV